MSGQYLAAFIMFFITIGVTSMFLLPAIKVKQKCEIVKFYWVGFWMFLAGLVAFAGSQSVLVILDHDVELFGGAILGGITAAYIVFVMFAWARLTLHGASSFLGKNNPAKLAAK
ncbi:MAG: hypothetical protein COA43_09490 [Robiginitomaculum sp.]|nr:MAG: hypothetical protein COA43_09490 [Robiginitomaculum sp.]